MFCPRCHNKIPDGSNVCPLCYANLAGVKPQAGQDAPEGAHKTSTARSKAYTRGSRGSKREESTDAGGDVGISSCADGNKLLVKCVHLLEKGVGRHKVKEELSDKEINPKPAEGKKNTGPHNIHKYKAPFTVIFLLILS